MLSARTEEMPWGHSSPVCGQDSFVGIAWLLEGLILMPLQGWYYLCPVGLTLSVPGALQGWPRLAKVGEQWLQGGSEGFVHSGCSHPQINPLTRCNHP